MNTMNTPQEITQMIANAFSKKDAPEKILVQMLLEKWQLEIRQDQLLKDKETSMKVVNEVLSSKPVTKEDAIEQLEKFRFTNIEYNGGNVLDFQGDSSQMNATFDEIVESKNAGELISKAEWISCCGDILCHDVPMCPSCKEWC